MLLLLLSSIRKGVQQSKDWRRPISAERHGSEWTVLMATWSATVVFFLLPPACEPHTLSLVCVGPLLSLCVCVWLTALAATPPGSLSLSLSAVSSQPRPTVRWPVAGTWTPSHVVPARANHAEPVKWRKTKKIFKRKKQMIFYIHLRKSLLTGTAWLRLLI